MSQSHYCLKYNKYIQKINQFIKKIPSYQIGGTMNDLIVLSQQFDTIFGMDRLEDLEQHNEYIDKNKDNPTSYNNDEILALYDLNSRFCDKKLMNQYITKLITVFTSYYFLYDKNTSLYDFIQYQYIDKYVDEKCTKYLIQHLYTLYKNLIFNRLNRTLYFLIKK
jgi:hypothetical protein